MTGINWLVLVLAVMLPVSFAFGRKVEREAQRYRDLQRRHAARLKQDQDLTRQYFD